jgi:hypothetical protein
VADLLLAGIQGKWSLSAVPAKLKHWEGLSADTNLEKDVIEMSSFIPE